jgi:hypothetical protein
MSPISWVRRVLVKPRLSIVFPKKLLSIALKIESIKVEENESRKTTRIRKTIPISRNFAQR